MFPPTLQRILQQSPVLRWRNRVVKFRLEIQEAKQWKRQIARLGSADEREYKAAQEWLLICGEATSPRLHRALRRSPGVACGAAGALYQLGNPQGIRHILLRAYQDEWFTYYPARDIADFGAHIGLRIGKEPVRQAVGRHWRKPNTSMESRRVCRN